MKMQSTYDPLHDVVVVTFNNLVLNSAEDVENWRDEVERLLSAYGKKVDLLIDLSGLHVKFGAGRIFGQTRAQVLAKYTKRSFRFGGDDTTNMFIKTSSMITGASGHAFETKVLALEALMAARKLAKEIEEKK